MKPTLDEQDISVYASDAQTIQEPFGSDYSQGVAVGKTIPAKWWNWLFKAATTRLHQAFSDLTNIFAELKNLILDAGLTPDATDSTQVEQAVVVKTGEQLPRYIAEEKQRFARQWDDYDCYDEQGNKIYLSSRVKIGDYFFANEDYINYGYYSLDSIHWKRSTKSYLMTGDGAAFAACYCNGYYIGIADCMYTSGQNIWSHYLYVWAGATPSTMQPISTGVSAVSYAGNLSGLSHVIAGNKVLIFTAAHTVVILDISTLTCTQYVGDFAGGVPPYFNYDYNDCLQGKSIEIPSILVNGNYVFGGCVRFDGATLTNLRPDTNTIAMNTHVPRRLRNGNIVFLKTASRAQLDDFKSYIMDTNGIVTESAYDFLPVYAQAYLEDCVLYADMSGDNSISFSYDGINFTKLPFVFDVTNITRHPFGQQSSSWTSIIQKDNKYFIVPRGAAPDFSILNLHEIDGDLSASIQDYLDTQFNMENIHIFASGYNQITGRGKTYDYNLRVGGASNALIGESNIELVFDKFIPVLVKYNGVFRAALTSSTSKNKKTSFGVNKVSGFTLYLR